MSFYVRFKSNPDEWVRYSSEKEYLDRKRWGGVLEVQTELPTFEEQPEQEEASDPVDERVAPQEPESVEETAPKKRRPRKASPDEESEGKEQ